MAEAPPNYLTTKDLMERWKCSYSFANAFMYRKTSKAFKLGRLLRIDEKEVIAYEKQNQISQED